MSIQCIAQTHYCKSAPVTGCAICRIPSRCCGSKDMPSADMSHLHQRMVVANKVHFLGCNLKLCLAQKVKNREISCKWLRIVSERMSMSSNDQRMFGRSLSGSNVTKVDCKYITAFVVPCSTRVGVFMPSGVIKD